MKFTYVIYAIAVNDKYSGYKYGIAPAFWFDFICLYLSFSQLKSQINVFSLCDCENTIKKEIHDTRIDEHTRTQHLQSLLLL